MKRILFLFVLGLCLIPVHVFAETCDDVSYREKVVSANLIKLNYTYDIESKKMKVSALNTPTDFYFTVDKSQIELKSDTRAVDLGSYTEGKSLLVYFYTDEDLGCGRGKLVAKRYITLPYYNAYAQDERCQVRAGMAACALFYPMLMTNDMFEEAIYSYDQQVYDIESNSYYQKKVIKNDPWYMVYRYYLLGGFIVILLGSVGAYYVVRQKQSGSEL